MEKVGSRDRRKALKLRRETPSAWRCNWKVMHTQRDVEATRIEVTAQEQSVQWGDPGATNSTRRNTTMGDWAEEGKPKTKMRLRKEGGRWEGGKRGGHPQVREKSVSRRD